MSNEAKRMVRIVEVHFTGDIKWRIHKNDLPTYSLQSFQGWSIINPLLYGDIILMRQPIESQDTRQTKLGFFIENFVYMYTPIMTFIPTTHSDDRKSEVNKFGEYLRSYLQSLRYVSNQARLANPILISFMIPYIEIAELPPLRFPQPDGSRYAGISRYRFDTAITWQHVESADQLICNKNLPLYSTLLLDAISAIVFGDYRRAILYAAISVETMARVRQDEEYNLLLQEGDTPGMLRLVSCKQRDGSHVTKDPIYEYFESKLEFKILLHERSLYILKRSLLIEDESLYHHAMKLYKTRNKIVHQGDLPSGDETAYFPVNKTGALEAINCAISLFKWFGVAAEYILPSTTSLNAEGVQII